MKTDSDAPLWARCGAWTRSCDCPAVVGTLPAVRKAETSGQATEETASSEAAAGNSVAAAGSSEAAAGNPEFAAGSSEFAAGSSVAAAGSPVVVAERSVFAVVGSSGNAGRSAVQASSSWPWG